MAKPRGLIIFDCDGVLIDSEVISTETLRQALCAHGLDVDIGYVRATYLGRSIGVVKEDFRRLVGHDIAPGFDADFLARLFAAYQKELSPMPGIVDLLAGLATPHCMATSSSVERASLSLEVTGLAPYFAGNVFCASMVASGKPAPDLFLYAARAMKVDPTACLVIEDSEVGVLAGRNAGMEVWRFVGGSHFDTATRSAARANSGVRVFDSMDEIAAALRED